MPSAFSQPIYPNLPSNVTDIFSTGENKGFYFSFCEGNLKNCKLKVSFLIRRIIIHVSSFITVCSPPTFLFYVIKLYSIQFFLKVDEQQTRTGKSVRRKGVKENTSCNYLHPSASTGLL